MYVLLVLFSYHVCSSIQKLYKKKQKEKRLKRTRGWWCIRVCKCFLLTDAYAEKANHFRFL